MVVYGSNARRPQPQFIKNEDPPDFPDLGGGRALEEQQDPQQQKHELRQSPGYMQGTGRALSPVSEVTETKLHPESLPHNFGNPKLSEITVRGQLSSMATRSNIGGFAVGSIPHKDQTSASSFGPEGGLKVIDSRCRLSRTRGLRSDPFYGGPGSGCLLLAGGWQVVPSARRPQLVL